MLELRSLLSAKECQIEQLEAACRELQHRLHEVREENASTTSMHDLQEQWLAVECIDLGNTCADLRTMKYLNLAWRWIGNRLPTMTN